MTYEPLGNIFSTIKTHALAILAGLAALLFALLKLANAKARRLEAENKANETTLGAFKAAYKSRTERDEKIRKAGQEAVDNPDFLNQDRL